MIGRRHHIKKIRSCPTECLSRFIREKKRMKKISWHIFKAYVTISWVLMPVNLGLGLGAGVLAGQNLGAGEPGRAERSSWQATGLATGLMVICSVAVLLWAENIVRIFNTDPELVAMSSTFLRIATAGYVVMAAGQVLMQSLSGAGDTVPPMVFGLVTSWLVTLPLALLLPKYTDLEILGVRWALVAGMVVQAVFAVVYFRLGRWKRKRV